MEALDLGFFVMVVREIAEESASESIVAREANGADAGNHVILKWSYLQARSPCLWSVRGQSHVSLELVVPAVIPSSARISWKASVDDTDAGPATY